ncbi:MAG: alpha/beta fold hydrolase [Simkaniaceae bacterium]|nr:MAG: alpha/beta fold hydrolase [Simkaniaceae bacterium]
MITFLHGFLGSPEDWKPITQLITTPFQTLTLPGHCGKPLDLSLLEREIPEKTTLVGYSLGGRLAMDFAKKFPERIEDLIILSANPGVESGREERIIQDEKWITLLEKEGMDQFLEKWYAQGLFSSFSLTEEVKNRRKMHDPHTLSEILRTLSPAKLPSMWPHLKDFSCSMLFLFGENDIKYQSIGKRLMGDYDVMWIPNASHPIHLEAPEIVAEIINRRSYDLSSRRRNQMASQR